MTEQTRISAARPGPALRAMRIGRHWTLQQMSRQTGLPVSTLSKIENGKMSLSYDKLVRVCEGLRIDIAELFAADTEAKAVARVTGRRSITRAGEGRVIDTENYLHVYPAADLLNKRFVPIVAEVHARSLAEFGEPISHPGEEFAYVLEGSVELHTALYAPVRLEAGDSIYFDSGMAHAYIAAGPGRCRVLSVCSASEAQLLEVSASAPVRDVVPPPETRRQPKVSRRSSPSRPVRRQRAPKI